MQSKPSIGIEVRIILLVSVLFLAGVSLPFDVLRQVSSLPYQGGTYLFLTFLSALLQKPLSLQTLYKHPQDAANLLSYFARQENYNDSYWWLQHKPQLLNLFSDEKTFLILAKSPWLFKPLRSLIEYSPPEFDKATSNRTFFNSLLTLASDHPDLQGILTSMPLLVVIIIEQPSLLPRVNSTVNNRQIEPILVQNPTLFPYFLFNPTIILPTTNEWVIILQPANNSLIATISNVIVLIQSLGNYVQPSLTLYLNGTRVRTLNQSNSLQIVNRVSNATSNLYTYLYNATMNATNLVAGTYLLQANITTNSFVRFLTYQVIVLVATNIAAPIAQAAAMSTSTPFLRRATPQI